MLPVHAFAVRAVIYHVTFIVGPSPWLFGSLSHHVVESFGGPSWMPRMGGRYLVSIRRELRPVYGVCGRTYFLVKGSDVMLSAQANIPDGR